METIFTNGVRQQSSNRGVALVVVLIFVVALSFIVIFSARNVSLGERLARNELDLQIAREAAEAALRDAEFDILLPSGALWTTTAGVSAKCSRGLARPVSEGITFFQPNCARGQCGLPETRYTDSNFATATATSNTGEPWWPIGKGGLWNENLASKPSTVNDPKCNTFTGAVPYGTYSARPDIIGVARQPEYLIEYFATGAQKNYRITARGFGRNVNTEVVMQSYFSPF